MAARYRKSRVDLSKLDPNSQEYWEEVLRREGLSMHAGKHTSRQVYGFEHFAQHNGQLIVDENGELWQTAGCGGGKRKLPHHGEND